MTLLKLTVAVMLKSEEDLICFMLFLSAVDPPSWPEVDSQPLSTDESWRLRVASAQVYSIVKNRDMEHFERVMGFLDATYRLLPKLVSPIKHMKLLFGLKTMVRKLLVVAFIHSTSMKIQVTLVLLTCLSVTCFQACVFLSLLIFFNSNINFLCFLFIYLSIFVIDFLSR